jgi:glycogen debranching enzyme
MVAADGSRCGTSPAWCLPFLNLQLLYLRTLDGQWLARVFPRAAAYLEWWLANRTDSEGWLVYKCTWESGEDGNPRLDPSGSGDAVISDHVRPVELQATVAHAAGVMAFFAAELGIDAERWHNLHAEYRERTSQLFDPSERRYRDWLIADQRFQPDCPDRPYWGIDTCRYSAQSLTPLLLGLPLDAREIWRHACPPWTLWPSWTWSIVESAAAAGQYAGIGEVAFEIIDRVYRATTRRDVAGFIRPMPGCAPEFWSEDWRTYAGSDAYGWGATTANLLVRHLFGIKESLETRRWTLDLTPAFPSDLLREGAHYAMRGLQYRGRRFDLAYTIGGDGRLEGQLDAAHEHLQFALRNGERITLRLA